VIATVVVLLLMAFGLAMVQVLASAKEENLGSQGHLKRLYFAESGLQAAMLDLTAGNAGNVGSALIPQAFGQGKFWTETTDNGNGTFTVLAYGEYNTDQRVIEGLIREWTPIFHHAVYAGNSSGDPTYVMDFGGSGGQADDINGKVYSGGDVNVWGDAGLSDEVRAQGTITGVDGEAGVTEKSFDFSQVDFSGPAVVNVVAEFAAHGTPVSDDAGGTAGQVPETNPAHILRLNPSDRTTENGGTAKDDYYIEDPYEPVGVDPDDDGTDPYMITIDAGSGTTRRAYYIDGNLWIHNSPSYSFMLATAAGTGVQVTFIVRGNITFSDSVRVQDGTKDAIAFIALEDPDEPDSGNIYLGDPSGGTLKELQAFLYAENDFLDVNLATDGSKDVRILGAMTAGNRVAIQRTWGAQHSKLTVDWDPRLRTGAATLPLVSSQAPDHADRLEAWVERHAATAGGGGP
jgi:hypothetical protein